MLPKNQNKHCTKCGVLKDKSQFSPHKGTKDRLASWCKGCHNQCVKNYYKKFPWLGTLIKIKSRCNNPKSGNYASYGAKGIQCLITKDELKYLWFRDKAFNLKNPSIDRIKAEENYTIENCKYIELIDNIHKAGRESRQGKLLQQFNLAGKLIATWKSCHAVERKLKIKYGGVSACCTGRLKKYKGFIWRYYLTK